jgi:tetratricopeptide (TPR) repeat protein
LEQHWLAVLHASAAIGQQPMEAEGYAVAGEALLRLGQAAEAAETLAQAVLLAPEDAAARSLLGQALVEAGRAQDAAEWQRLRLSPAVPLAPGAYQVLRADLLGPKVAAGWRTGWDGSLLLGPRSARLDLLLPGPEQHPRNLVLDLRVPAGWPEGITLHAGLEGRNTRLPLAAEPRVQSLAVALEADAVKAGPATFELRLEPSPPPGLELVLIGLQLAPPPEAGAPG